MYKENTNHKQEYKIVQCSFSSTQIRPLFFRLSSAKKDLNVCMLLKGWIFVQKKSETVYQWFWGILKLSVMVNQASLKLSIGLFNYF